MDRRIARLLQKSEDRQQFNIHELARTIGLSISRLEHLFKENTGKSFRDYIVEQHLNAAADLLRHSELQIKEISYRVGYKHPQSFVRAFRRKFSVSPQRFRGGSRFSEQNSTSG